MMEGKVSSVTFSVSQLVIQLTKINFGWLVDTSLALFPVPLFPCTLNLDT